MWDESIIHSQTSTVQPLKLGNGWVIYPYTSPGTCLDLSQTKLVKGPPVGKNTYCVYNESQTL